MKKILIIIIVIFALYYYYPTKSVTVDTNISKYFMDQPKIVQTIKNDNKIFVSIASYRDPQLNATIQSLIDNCHDISNVRIVVCEQNDISDNFSISRSDIDIIKMSHTEARGPTWARYLIQKKWLGEQYYLQIDSHTRFVKHWDKLLKEQLMLLPEKSCLSNYVSTYDINSGNVIKSPLRGPMYIVEKDPIDQFYRFNSKYVKTMTHPTISNGWSGCFSFSSSQIIIDVPYDPYLPFLFFGEEMDIYLRLLKKKWKLYVPSVPICFTLFDRSYRKTFWEHPDNKIILPYSKMRLYKKLGLKINAPDFVLKSLNYYR